MAFSLWITRWVVMLLVLLSSLSLTRAVTIKCGECEESRCPELHYCEGIAVKDHCGCCTVCSSSKYQPHPLITGNTEREGGACTHVKCPKYKVCVENIQGLPLCTCPSTYICRGRRRRQRPICGTDGVTYLSRCHLRIAACNTAVKIKVARKGPCDGADVPRSRACESFSTCKKRKNQRSVCGTDGKTYISRCHMKITACQKGVKVKLKNHGICQKAPNPGPSSSQRAQASGVSSNGVPTDVRKRDGRRKRKKNGGNDATGSDDGKNERRKRKREKRKKRKERRRKRRKTRGKRRSRRYKIDKNRFHRTFGHIRWRH